MTPRLFAHALTLEARKLMTYRFEFWANLLVHLVVAVGVPYFLWSAIFAHSEAATIRGFTFQGMVIYYICTALFGRIVLGPEFLYDVSTDIYEGGLNRFLVYPTHYFAFKYAQHLGVLFPYLLQTIVLGPVLVFWVGVPEELRMHALGIAGAFVAVLVANLLYYVLAFPLQSVSFWADNVWSLVVLQQILSRLLGGAMVPLDLFPESVQTLFRLLPYASLYDLPVSTLLGRVSLEEWLARMALSAFWIAAFAGLGSLIWRRGLRSYTGVGI